MFKIKNLEFFFFILVMVNNTLLIGKQDLKREDSILFSCKIQKEQCCKSLSQLKKNIVSVLDDLYKQLDYWQKAHYRSFGYFIEKGPLRWLFGKKQSIEIQKALECVNNEIVRNTYYLGYITELECTLETEPTDRHINHIALAVHAIVNFSSVETIPQHDIGPDTNNNFVELVETNQKGIQNYKKQALYLVHDAQRPGHLQRHWVGYSISTLCSLVCLGYYFKNKEQIIKTIKDGKGAISNFYNDYLYTPLKNSYEIINGKKDEPLVNNTDITTEEQIAQIEISSYLKATHKKLSSKDIDTKTSKMIKNRQSADEVATDFAEQSQYPVWSVVNNYMLRLVIIEWRLLKLKGYDCAKKLDELLQRNKLLFEILLTIPTAVLSYASYKILQKTYNLFLPKKELVYKPIKHALLTIETILNEYVNTPLSYSVNGQLYYWQTKLRKAIPFIPFEARIPFSANVAELTSVELTVQQKLNTVQRMFRAYEFLH